MIDRGMLAGLPQTIGKSLDFRKWLNLTNGTGAELLTGGTFTGGSTGWTLAAGWTYGSNAVAKDGDGIGTLAEDAFAAVVAEVYLLSYVISSWTVGTVTPSIGGASGAAVGANGTYRVILRATTTAGLSFAPTNTARFTIDTISVKKLGTQAADQVLAWVEDQGGTAGKATLYIRGENGTVVGIGGDGFTFGANDEDVTLAYTADTLTLAGGVFLLPRGTLAAPSVGSSDSINTGFSFPTQGGALWGNAGSARLWLENDFYVRSDAAVAWLDGAPPTGTADLSLRRDAAAILQQGVDAAAPATQTLKGPDARAGTDTDTVGGRINWRTGLSTGNADPAVQFMQGGAATVTSGTGAQTVVDRFTPNAFVVLTDGSATAVVNATIANGTSVGGFIVYTIEVWDGTDNQVETGTVVYSSKNKAGVVTGTITEVSSQQDLDSGTLATTWAISAANPAVISVNANSSLTPSTGFPRITFSLQNLGQQAVAIQ